MRVRGPRRPAALSALADILFGIYLAVLLRLTVFRPDLGGGELFSGDLNLSLFTELISLIRRGGAYYFYRLLLGNIAAFVPFGAYLAWRTNMKLFGITLAGAAASLAIELLQFTFAVGVCEIDDLILNTVGTFAGAAAVMALRLLIRREAQKREDTKGKITSERPGGYNK